MSQMERISSQRFWSSGFVVQINDDQFFVAEGPFTTVRLHKQGLEDQLSLNRLLIKANYWDFLKSESTEALQPQSSKLMTRKEFQALVQQAPSRDLQKISNISWSLDFKEQFSQQFQFMQDMIAQGQLEKAVPIGVSRTLMTSTFQPQPVIRNLLEDSTGRGWLYGFWTSDQGILGRTPELLFQSYPLQNKKISTMALAGTWSKNSSVVNDYKDSKIWNEHHIVVKDIKNQLSGLECTFQSPTEVIELKTLAHLKTQLEFRYTDFEQIFDVVQDLHPTAALGIYPRSLEMYKAVYEMPLQADRGGFGAPFGVIGKDISHLIVSIRGVFWKGNELRLFAGCGITKDSQLESEYQEILLKMAAVKKMLGF